MTESAVPGAESHREDANEVTRVGSDGPEVYGAVDGIAARIEIPLPRGTDLIVSDSRTHVGLAVVFPKGDDRLATTFVRLDEAEARQVRDFLSWWLHEGPVMTPEPLRLDELHRALARRATQLRRERDDELNAAAELEHQDRTVCVAFEEAGLDITNHPLADLVRELASQRDVARAALSFEPVLFDRLRLIERLARELVRADRPLPFDLAFDRLRDALADDVSAQEDAS